MERIGERHLGRQCHIIGAATGYTYAQLRPFLLSLKAIGFSGTVHMLLFEEDSALAADLAERGPIRINTHYLQRSRSLFANRCYRLVQRLPLAGFNSTVPRLTPSKFARHILDRALPVSSLRYFVAHQIVASLPPEALILLSDTRDVYFQADPFAFYESEHDGRLVLSMETHRIEPGNVTYRWVRELYGREFADHHKGKPASCSGTTLGNRAAMMAYLNAMLLEIYRQRNRISHTSGYDQGIHNYLYYASKLAEVDAPPNGAGPYLVVQKLDPPTQDGIVRRSTSERVPIIHQYDRVPNWTEQSAYFARITAP